MSEENIPETGPAETRKTFAYVVDGEIAFISHVHDSIEILIAVLSSDPKVVQVPDELKYDFDYNWTYDQNGFHPPA